MLYQGRQNRFEFDLRQPGDLRNLIRQFTAYSAPDYEKFHDAVREFQERVPELGASLRERIATERESSPAFSAAFAQFYELCRTALNPQIAAAEIEKVIDALTRRAFNRVEFLRSLDRYYVPIENAARTISDWNEKQSFLNRIYVRFFQDYRERH